jgi:uncharacterized protein YndB with AHSA1/START domain
MDTTSTITAPKEKTGRAPLERHEEASALLDAPLERVFDYLDDFRKLSSHMQQRSGMMAGSGMTIETDERDGRTVGSEVRMHGRMMGVALSLTEVVTEREPPLRKAWQTTDARLMVIGQYRLGFELTPEGTGTRARIFIDYALPERVRWLGVLFARTYARWCVGRMAADAARHFNP